MPTAGSAIALSSSVCKVLLAASVADNAATRRAGTVASAIDSRICSRDLARRSAALSGGMSGSADAARARSSGVAGGPTVGFGITALMNGFSPMKGLA